MEVERRVGNTAFTVQLYDLKMKAKMVVLAAVTRHRRDASSRNESFLGFVIHVRKLQSGCCAVSCLLAERFTGVSLQGVLRFISVCPSVAAGMTSINRPGACDRLTCHLFF